MPSRKGGWRGDSLSKQPRRAPQFYLVITAAMAVGLKLDFAGLNAVEMLFWSAVMNGGFAPPLVSIGGAAD